MVPGILQDHSVITDIAVGNLSIKLSMYCQPLNFRYEIECKHEENSSLNSMIELLMNEVISVNAAIPILNRDFSSHHHALNKEIQKISDIFLQK